MYVFKFKNKRLLLLLRKKIKTNRAEILSFNSQEQ